MGQIPKAIDPETGWPMPTLFRRGRKWWVHQTVPIPLRDFIGQNQFQHSLNTEDYEVALRRVKRMQEDYYQQFKDAQVRESFLSSDRPVYEKILEIIAYG